MLRYVFVVLVGALLLVPSTASAQKVTKDWDKAYDFTTVKTFAVKVGTPWGNPLSENRAVVDITEVLTEKGWQRGQEESADTLVVLHGATETKHNVSTFYDSWGGWGYYGGPSMSTTMVSEYRVGTLVVDVFDAKTKKLAYRGTATDEISKDPSKNEKKLDKAAQKIFKDFPPVAKKK